MKNILFIILVLIYGNHANAQVIHVSESTIKEVTVYFQGAEINKAFSVQLPQGKSELIVHNLSASIDANSLMASNTSQVKIVSITQDIGDRFKQENNTAIKFTQDTIELLQNKIKLKGLQIEALEEEKKSLLKNSVRMGNPNGITLVELDQSLIYLRKKQEEINQLLVLKETEQEQLTTTLGKVNERLKVLQAKDSSSSANISLLVESSTAQKADFSLTYYVNACGWAPSYNIYSQGVNQSMELEYKANILNNSGEDWNKVKIKLQAGNPSKSLVSPQLDTWVLSYGQKRKNGKTYGVTESGNEGALSKKQIKSSNLNELQGEEIEIEEGIMAFNLHGVHTIPSQEREFLLDISKHTLAASYRYQTIPKLDTKAYLIAKVADWEDLKLIEGDANVFLNQTYVGRTYIDPLSAGDSMDFSLGPDPSIQITRVKKKDFSTKKLVGLQLFENFGYEIDLRNLNKTPIQIEVIDQIPIPQQEEIHISVEDDSGANLQPTNGKMTWNLAVPAQQSVKLKMAFSIRYPRDKVVLIKRTGRVICPKFR